TLSRAYAASPASELRSLYSYSQLSPTPTYPSLDDAAPFLEHLYGQSQENISAFSTPNKPAPVLQPVLGPPPLVLVRGASRGFTGSRRHKLRGEVATPPGGHESSSGASTPGHMLFSRLQHTQSTRARSGSAGRPAGPLALRATGRRARATRAGSLPHYQGGEPRQECSVHGPIHQEPADSDIDGGHASLRFSTSTPDVLYMPAADRFGRQTHAIRHPDHSCGRILAVSRAAKIGRWRRRRHHHHSGSPADSIHPAEAESPAWIGWTDSRHFREEL
ncbi:hypothetical protein IWQ56_003470, partial [Coemansia nantahalensis]